jgi:hypothetical protein
MAQQTITPEARLPTYPVNPVVLDTVVQMYHECTMDCDSPNVDDLLNQFSDTIETLLGSHGYSNIVGNTTPTYVPRYIIDATMERLIIMCPDTDIVMHQICYHWDCECADCMNPQQFPTHDEADTQGVA